MPPSQAQPRRAVWRMLGRWVLMVALVYTGLLALLWWKQEWLIFRPRTLAPDAQLKLAPDVHEAWVEVDGARLHALHLRLPKPDGVVFSLHGNGGAVVDWFSLPDVYRRANLDLFMIDYRGYGKSSGRIVSEAQLMNDMRLAWRSIAARYAGQRVVFMGSSLGSGLAAALAAEVQPDLTLLVSPYLSMEALAAEQYPWVPGALLRYPLRTDLALPLIRGGLTLIHGERDTLIAADHSRALHQIRPDSRMVIVQGAGHNDLRRFPAYVDALQSALGWPAAGR